MSARSDVPKQYLEIGAKPVLSYSINTLASLPFIGEIIVVAASEWLEHCKTNIIDPFVSQSAVNIKLVNGGETRQESSRNGVIASTLPYVMIHDGARPFVSAEEIERLYSCMIAEGAAILATPITDTVKELSETRPARIKRTVERSFLWAAATPQAFERETLLNAYDMALKLSFSGTDDASLLEHAGASVTIVEGSRKNIKITTIDDLIYADFLVRRDEN